MVFKYKFRNFIIITGIIFFFLIGFIFSNFTGFNKIYADTIQCNSDAEKAQCQKDLDDLNQQIQQLGQYISDNKDKQASLSRDINILKAQITQKTLEIKKADNNIYSLSNKIMDKNVQLNDLSDNLDKQKSALALALRNLYVFDGSNNFINLILDDKSLSQFFEDSDNIIALQGAINQDVDQIKTTTDQVNQVKSDLEDSKDTQVALKEQQQSDKNKIDASKQIKNNLLTETKGQEALYNQQLKDKQAKAAEIRAALFSFAGGETRAIPFGDALDYANTAQSKTGVPAAFVLSILQQESALGANVGKCYLSDTESGAGFNINTKQQFSNVMKASRDLPGFLTITNRLGINPLATVVSCPIPSAGGYGGAMGPAQFIPSTWLSIEDGAGVSNPWNAEDAIMASAYYLSTLGASDSYASQIKAACRYYGTGGGSCSYGRSVMAKVDDTQAKIDYIKQYGQ